MPNVRIPTPLRKLTNEKDEVQAAGGTVSEIVEDLEKNFPGMKDRLCDESGEIRRFVNVFINDEDVRFLQEKANLPRAIETPVKEGDEVSIVPAIAGG